jgi:hypothetical protein
MPCNSTRGGPLPASKYERTPPPAGTTKLLGVASVSCRLESEFLSTGVPREQHEGRFDYPVVTEVSGPAGRVEDQVESAEVLFDALAAFLPANGHRAVEYEISLLNRASIAAHCDTPRQMNHFHAITMGRRPGLADIIQACKARLPDRPPLSMAHHMAGEFALARVVAGRIER